MERYTDIADDLVAAINESNLSVRDIAKKSGVPAATIFGWLGKDSKTPSFRNAFYVFSALGYEMKISRKENK